MYPHQAERLTRTLESRGLAALVATSVENVAYVTGFRSLTKEVYRTPSFAVFAPRGTALVVPAIDLAAIVADADAVDHVLCFGGFVSSYAEPPDPARGCAARLGRATPSPRRSRPSASARAPWASTRAS